MCSLSFLNERKTTAKKYQERFDKKYKHDFLDIEKKSLDIFYWKMSVFFIFYFLKRYLQYSSEGTKNNRKKYRVIVEIFPKKMFFHSHVFMIK